MFGGLAKVHRGGIRSSRKIRRVRRARVVDVRGIKRVVGIVRNPNCDRQTTIDFGLPISVVKFTVLGQILPITVHIDLTLEQRYHLFGLIVSGLLGVTGSIM
jgi:hypothetical protein